VFWKGRKWDCDGIPVDSEWDSSGILDSSLERISDCTVGFRWIPSGFRILFRSGSIEGFRWDPSGIPDSGLNGSKLRWDSGAIRVGFRILVEPFIEIKGIRVRSRWECICIYV
jgi:hypothetical protein